jgi:Domain of unknown function (DUF4253)
MTILETLPPMHTRGAVELSRAPFDDATLYGRLLAAAPDTGRCPALLADHALGSLTEGWEAATVLADVQRRDVAAVLGERYPSGCVYHPDCLAPFGGTFPGLAPATAGAALLRPDEVVTTAVGETDLLGEHLLGLVPVSRPADVPAAVGWCGAAGSWQPWDDVAALSAVLRSWEDRFGAVLVKMGRATLDLAVAAPPWERSECIAIAAEHYAFCDDTYKGNPGTLRDYANLLRGCTRWSFWWE